LGLESDDYDNYLFLQIPSGKKGRYDYLKKLSQGTTFVVNHLKLEQNVLICCEDGIFYFYFILFYFIFLFFSFVFSCRK